jgi:hypothetical protein
MNSVLLGVDYITTDDEILLLEMNTDINLSYSKFPYFDLESLFDYITVSGFTTLHLVYKAENVSEMFINQIKGICLTSDIAYEETQIPYNSVTIPSIEDSETKLILRFAYNAQAILDDTYCRDKNELIKLLFDGNSETDIPKTMTTYSGVTIDNLTSVNDNGQVPNLIIKKQLPDFNKNNFPAFYKADDVTELNTVKGLVSDGLFLQEYKFSQNNVEQSMIVTHVRKWYLVSNGLSDVIDCGGYLQSNQVELDETVIEYTDLKLNNMSRAMFFSNPVRANSEGVPSNYLIDVEQIDGSFSGVTASDLNIGDVVKALNIDTLDYNFNRVETINWEYSGDTQNLLTYTTASVISVINKPVEDWFNRIDYSDGVVSGSSLLPLGKMVLSETNGVTKFKNVADLSIGDSIFNSPTQMSTITSIGNEYYSGSMSMVDIEPSDVFIAGTNTNEILNTLVVHNRCTYK